ncbi:hypothetical protein HY524_01965 [Candidatus Berkelbacteria bacterium]|nr:hypothetical protein [Candidatus Berkelbacteria bacterium]
MKEMDDLGAFGALINALEQRDSGGGDPDRGRTFPKSDSNDLLNGATHIPGEVTDARRSGQKVKFVTDGPKSQWYWLMPNGDKIQHG